MQDQKKQILNGMFKKKINTLKKGRHGHDRMVVGITTTYAISTYHY